jgi:hypothetical protein
MSSKDIFGYSRTAEANALVSSEYAVFTIDSSEVKLIQNCQVQYQHRVTPKFESGSSDLFWQTGQPQGTLNFSKLIGKGGFFDGFNFEKACGDLIKMDISLENNSGCEAIKLTATGGLSFNKAMPQIYTAAWNVGSLDVTEGGTILLSQMSKKT